MQHERFHYKSLNDLKTAMSAAGADFPLSENTSVLAAPYKFASHSAANRILFQPMEASDSEDDGSPGDMTFRRYERYAYGGPGVLWFEAVSIAKEACASRHQLYMNEKNVDGFKRLVDRVKAVCLRQNGFEPLCIIQSTHSGRYSKPEGVPAPLIACNNPLYEGDDPIPEDRIMTDGELDALPDLFGKSARLAAEAGFDGVDVKLCHRYLLNELLCAYTRGGNYGGSFENRTRLIMQVFSAAAAEAPSNLMLTTRLNVYDGFPYPYGFGVSPEGGLEPDLSEPLLLIRKLREKYGPELINISVGNPYVNPHVMRPYDKGNYVPDEHPLEGVARMTGLAGEIQKAFPDIAVACSGLSYLREFSDKLAAGMVESGSAAFAGFGRLALAWPDFARAIIEGKDLDPGKVCLTCGQCSKLLRAGLNTGCVIRDREAYPPAADQ